MTIVAIDFEASCLPRDGRSFPIEVGICDHRGSRSWLIRPDDAWSGWDWTAQAEALHGLAKERLLAEGLPAGRVMAELAEAVGGRRLVADSGIDRYWMETLARAAGWSVAPGIAHVGAVLDETGATSERIADACDLADRLQRERHRAEADARWLFIVIDALRTPGILPAPAPGDGGRRYAEGLVGAA
jgi:hypothetical protein